MVVGKKQKGFTVVELLIVIVVIGILAALVVTSFAQSQAKARDADRMNDIAQLKKALNLYSVDHGDYANAGCGNGSGSGWLTSDYDGSGPYRPINTCLIEGGYLTAPLADPSGQGSCSGLECHAYMKANCGGTVYLYANLETRPQSGTDSDHTCYNAWDTSYGMNYVVKVN